MTAQFFKSTLLNEIDHVNHGFFGRKGGVSTGHFEGLNIGYATEDKPENINKNRQIICKTLDIEMSSLATIHQIHSADVVIIREKADIEKKALYKADALVTTISGIALGVLTADCVPVLLSCKKNKIIGAAHAGWSGALNGVVDNTLYEMQKLGAELSDISISIGPHIHVESYEVQEDFRECFLNQSSENTRYFEQVHNQAGYQFNLTAYLSDRIQKNFPQIGGIEVLKMDTYNKAGDFYSHRRSCHEGHGITGRQMSVIFLK